MKENVPVVHMKNLRFNRIDYHEMNVQRGWYEQLLFGRLPYSLAGFD